MTVKSYASQDQNGAHRVGETRVSLDSVVHGFHKGLSAETIAEQYPTLTLEEVYRAIAFYLANHNEIDEYLGRRQELWDKLRAEADAAPSPLVERLRAQRVQKAARKTVTADRQASFDH